MKTEKLILAIFKREENDSFSFKGTGFIISRDGIFLSASHVFRTGEYRKENFVCAFPSNESPIFQISFLAERHNLKNPQGPVHNDFAIGKIDFGFKYSLKLKRKRPEIGDFQKVTGYINVKPESNKNRFQLSNKGKLNLSDIQITELTTLLISRKSIISEDLNDYEKPEHLVENRKKYNNCITLKWAEHHGVSGAPVFNEDFSVSGIYFGGPKNRKLSHLIASKFVTKEIRKLTRFKRSRFNGGRKNFYA